MGEAVERLTRLRDLADLERQAQMRVAEGWFKGSSDGNGECMFLEGKVEGVGRALDLFTVIDGDSSQAKLMRFIEDANREYEQMVKRVGDNSVGNRTCRFLDGKREGAKVSLALIQDETDVTTETVTGYIYKTKRRARDIFGGLLTFVGLLPKASPLEVFIGQMQKLKSNCEERGLDVEIVREITGTRCEIFRVFLQMK